MFFPILNLQCWVQRQGKFNSPAMKVLPFSSGGHKPPCLASTGPNTCVHQKYLITRVLSCGETGSPPGMKPAKHSPVLQTSCLNCQKILSH